MRPMTAAVGALTFMAVLLWVVAALIVGSVIYLSALERTRDFAVLKAVGVSTRAVLAGLCLQAVIVAVAPRCWVACCRWCLGRCFQCVWSCRHRHSCYCRSSGC